MRFMILVQFFKLSLLKLLLKKFLEFINYFNLLVLFGINKFLNLKFFFKLF